VYVRATILEVTRRHCPTSPHSLVAAPFIQLGTALDEFEQLTTTHLLSRTKIVRTATQHSANRRGTATIFADTIFRRQANDYRIETVASAASETVD